MARKEQFKILLRVLHRFHQTGVLDELMLIGSWSLYFYRLHFQDPPSIPPVRTLDVDFLIPHASRVRKEADIPAILKEEGFLPVFNRSSGVVKYNHPELGKGTSYAHEVKMLNIKAQGLRYLNLLLDHPLTIRYEGFEVRVPEPAVFALHKLIVSSRRAKAEKRSKDLEAAIGIFDFLWRHPREIEKIKSILRSVPQSWRKLIASVAERHYPPVNEVIKSL